MTNQSQGQGRVASLGLNVSKSAVAVALIMSLSPAAAFATTAAGDASPAGIEALAEEEGYTYGYAGLTWAEYWANEGVYNAADTSSSEVQDAHGEYDKGGYDVVTRATTNHGLHRGSYQCIATIYAADAAGNQITFSVQDWSADGKTFNTTDGKSVEWARGAATYNGTAYTMTSYEVSGYKYVPVKIKTSDLEAFKATHSFVGNGEAMTGGYGEKQLSAYSVTAAVDEDTNGLKAVTMSGTTASFSAAATGTGSGIAGQEIKKAIEVTGALLKNEEAAEDGESTTGNYGEFIRFDLKGAGYGDLGANMQAVIWTYYGNDSSYSKAVATYGTKFAADTWMHKSMGIQLGLTDSARCQLPAGYDGTGYWKITVRALGYEDATFTFQATADNIADFTPASDELKAQLQAVVDKAKALNESDYTAASWANLTTELEESEDLLIKATIYTSEVKGQIKHMQNAIDELVAAPSFTDVAADAWYHDAVIYIAEKGIINGYTDGSGRFGSTDALSREQFATILWRYACPDEAKAYNNDAANATPLVDVADNGYYTAAINWAYENGVINGYTDGSNRFGTGDAVSFEQMLTILGRYVVGQDSLDAQDTSVLSAYRDEASISSYAKGALAWAVSTGLVSGYDNGDGTKSLGPDSQLQRARGAMVLYNAFQQEILK